MKLLAALNALTEAKKYGKQSFVIKDWDEITLGKHDKFSVGPLDVKVTFDIDEDGSPTNIRAASVAEVALCDTDGNPIRTKSLPADTDVIKLPGWEDKMWKNIETEIDKKIDDIVKWNREND